MPQTNPNSTMELKGIYHQTLKAIIGCVDKEALLARMMELVNSEPEFLKAQPLILDLTRLESKPTKQQLSGMLSAAKTAGFIPVGFVCQDPDMRSGVESLGVAYMHPEEIRQPASKKATAGTTPPESSAAQPSSAVVMAASAAAKAYMTTSAADPAGPMVVDQPVRSGMQIYAKGRDLIVMAPVSNGAEIISDGNVYVFGPMMGRAVAGASGNSNARIFASDLRAQLVAIDGVYSNFVPGVPEHLSGRLVQIRLTKQDDRQTIQVDPI